MISKKSEVNPCIMAIGAHADDIEIHAGGTLEKYFHQGYEIFYVMATNNMSGKINRLNPNDPDGPYLSEDEPAVAMMARRKSECEIAAREWNAIPVHLDYPQRHYTDENLQRQSLRYGAGMPASVLDNAPSILTAGEEEVCIEKMASLILEKNPECILTHGVAQVNPEHFGTCLLVTNGYWRAVEYGYHGALLHWREHHEQFGEFNRHWETFVDYSALLERKMELIAKHQCQMPHAMRPDFGHRRVAVEFGKACGCRAAEPFTWVHRFSNGSAPHPTGKLTSELIQNTR